MSVSVDRSHREYHVRIILYPKNVLTKLLPAHVFRVIPLALLVCVFVCLLGVIFSYMQEEAFLESVKGLEERAARAEIMQGGEQATREVSIRGGGGSPER